MPTFTYKVLDRAGQRTRGTITAANGKHARQQLRDQGMRIESIRQRVSGADAPAMRSMRRSQRYGSQLTTAIRELATLLQAGVPLLDALDSVLVQAKRGFHDAVLAVRDRVASGESLADAMSSEPSVFDEMTVGMIGVGEHAGNLDEICEQVAEFRERSGELKDKIVSSLLYPAIILVVSIGVTVFLMTVVVPMLLQNLVEIGRPLPLPTTVLKWLSDSLIEHGLWMFLAALTFTAVCGYLATTPHGRRRIDEVSLSTPLLGTLIQKQSLSRMALVVSTLLKSGVELVRALEIAEKSSTNLLLKTALADIRQDLQSGRDLREATLKHRIFPHSMTQVFSLGQQSGQLEKMLRRIGNDYDRQASILANRLATVIEPVLILVLSVIVGFILFATVLPILEAGNVLAG